MSQSYVKVLMATARVATTIHENGEASYSSGDPCGRHAHTAWSGSPCKPCSI